MRLLSARGCAAGQSASIELAHAAAHTHDSRLRALSRSLDQFGTSDALLGRFQLLGRGDRLIGGASSPDLVRCV